jgi:hypothetical protein
MKLHLRPEEITIRPNSTTSKWENLEDLVARGDISVTHNDNQDDQGARFREAYENALEEDHELGAAVRWAVLGKKGGGLRLALEGLPGTAQTLSRKPELSSDGSAAIILDATPLIYEAEPKNLGSSPVPILFARDPALTLEALAASPENLNEGKENYAQGKNQIHNQLLEWVKIKSDIK